MPRSKFRASTSFSETPPQNPQNPKTTDDNKRQSPGEQNSPTQGDSRRNSQTRPESGRNSQAQGDSRRNSQGQPDSGRNSLPGQVESRRNSQVDNNSRRNSQVQSDSRRNSQEQTESRRNSPADEGHNSPSQPASKQSSKVASRQSNANQNDSRQSPVSQSGSRTLAGEATPGPSGSQRAAPNGSQQRQQSQMSQRSPAISRTPSADRRLLRTLTVSPNADEIDEYDDPSRQSVYSTQHTPSRNSQQSQQSRNSQQTGTGSRYSADRTPTGTPNRVSGGSRTPSEHSNHTNGRTTVQLPETREAKGDEWQSNKSVPEANSYMLKYEVACDVTFIVGDAKEDIRAHKYMLMARSPILFKSLVKHQGNQDVKIGVPDMKPDIFRDMLQYIYTDEFDIHAENVTSILYAAKKFQLKGLTTICFQYLDAEMHDETVAKIMEQAHIYNETGLYEKCVRYILTNATTVLKKQGFGELCDECVGRIIRSDDLRAPEEAVFEGAVTWANAECRRQKKQPTDANRRQVLGKLLYFIRFPIMDVTYFTQKVSLGDLLSHDETLSIFQFFHGEEQQLPNRFSRNERNRLPRNINENTEPVMLTSRSPAHGRVHRFPAVDGQWKQNGPPDAISFTVSAPIVLYGAEVYGVANGKETFALKILVYDDITREEIRKNDASIFTSSVKETYDVYLTRPLRIPARRVFTVMVMMKGNPTFTGVDGEKVHIVDGVQFEFIDSNRSSNGTDCNVGQIAGLLFNKTQ